MRSSPANFFHRFIRRKQSFRGRDVLPCGTRGTPMFGTCAWPRRDSERYHRSRRLEAGRPVRDRRGAMSATRTRLDSRPQRRLGALTRPEVTKTLPNISFRSGTYDQIFDLTLTSVRGPPVFHPCCRCQPRQYPWPRQDGTACGCCSTPRYRQQNRGNLIKHLQVRVRRTHGLDV